MEYKEMEHQLDSTRKNPVMGEKYSQLLPGDLICECQFSCGWCQLIVVCVRNLMKFCFGYQSSACPPGRIVREAVSSLEYSERLRYMEAMEDAIRRLIVVWYSRGLEVIKAKGFCSEVGGDAKNVGKEVATREKKNRRNSVSEITDNHPVGSRCLARRSVEEMHLENAEVRCEKAVELRTGIWAEI